MTDFEETNMQEPEREEVNIESGVSSDTADFEPLEDILPAEKKPKKKRNFFVENGIIIFCVLAILFIFFVARLIRVDGTSMTDTLQDGDIVVLWQLNYQPEIGDIVVIGAGENVPERYIKRIVALEGDTLKIENDTVTVNGEMLNEPYIREADWGEESIEMTIPDEQIFVMGDNRNGSHDSRAIGPINKGQVQGKVIQRLFPFDTFGSTELK